MFRPERILLLATLAFVQVTWVMTSPEAEYLDKVPSDVETMDEDGNRYMEGLLEELLAQDQGLEENDLGKVSRVRI